MGPHRGALGEHSGRFRRLRGESACSRTNRRTSLYHVALDDPDGESDLSTAASVEQAIRNANAQLADTLDRLSGLKGAHDPYFPPSDEWTGYKSGSKLVRLDVAVMAIHLASARVAFRPLPHIIRLKMEKTKEALLTASAIATSFYVLRGFVGVLFRLALDFIHLWDGVAEQMLFEQNIRLNMAKTQRELFGMTMGVGHHKVTKWVSSRHKTPTQRAENGR